MTQKTAAIPAEFVVRAGLARGRALFHRGRFWSSHEAWESAWRAAEEPEKTLLQGLIQGAAAFHKLFVQSNAHGAARLLDRSLARLPEDPAAMHRGLAVGAFAAHLSAWRARIAAHSEPPEPVGLPRLDASPASLMRVDTVRLWRLPGPADHPGVILVEVAARGVSGWGECPLSWELRGVWESLEQALAPALLAEPFGAPSELEVIWDDVVGVASARAGLEAAVWDLWARANDVPLTTALGQEARPVPRAVAVELPPMVGGDPRAFLHRVLDGVGTEADMLHVALHPPFEHRWGAPILEEADRSVAFDLGGRCGRQDMAALRALDALGPALIIQPFARGLEHHAARLRRVAHAPISLGGFPSAETAEAAVMAHACDVLHVEPGWIGATEALRVLDVADVHGLPAWVSGAAVTPVGAAMDAAVAAHPAVTLPSRLGSVSAAASARGPDRAWLSAQALAVRVLRA